MSLQVCKKPLRETQMAEAYVLEAKSWADMLVRAEFRGPGDTIDAAMARCERKHKIDRSTLWSLRYRLPKDMMVSAYMALRAAYHSELKKMQARLEHELLIARAEGLDETNSPIFRMAAAQVGQNISSVHQRELRR